MLTFATPDALLDAVAGPAQHDSHVIRRRRAVWLMAQRAFADRADARVRRAADDIRMTRLANIVAATVSAAAALWYVDVFTLNQCITVWCIAAGNGLLAIRPVFS